MAEQSQCTLAAVTIDALINDAVMVFALHGALIALLLMAVFATVRVRWRRTSGAVVGKVSRGERSMTIIYVVYGVGTVALTLAVQVAEAVVGYKVVIITFDYVVLSYLFFFNSWFRNLLLGLLRRVHED